MHFWLQSAYHTSLIIDLNAFYCFLPFRECPGFTPKPGFCLFVLSTITDGIMNRNTSFDEVQKPRYIHGLDGLAKLIGCSKPTAHKIKNSGVIPYARIGNKFIFEEEKVMAALAFDGKELTNG